MKRLTTYLLDCFFLLRIPLLAPVWTILLLGWITSAPQCAWQSNSYPGLILTCMQDRLWLAMLGFSLIVAAIYVMNQISDVESDRINRKLFLLPHHFVSIRAAWVLTALCSVTGIALSIVYFDRVMVVLFIFSLLLGCMYNLPPVALKNRAIGGLAANFLGHGMLTYLIGWHAARVVFTLPEPLMSGIVASLSAGFANGAVFLATTIPDADGDLRTGKQTFCVAYGAKATAITAAFLCLGAVITAFWLPHNRWTMAGPGLVSLILFIYNARETRRETAFSAFKWPVFILSLTVALFVPPYALLILVTFFGSRLYYRWRFNIEYPTFKAL